MARYLGCLLLALLLVPKLAWAQAGFDDSRVALLPDVLPAIPGLSPLEQARAQALASFLNAHRLYRDGGCDPALDLCLPDFSPGVALDPLPQEAAAVLVSPVSGPILIDFAESSQGDTPTFGLTYLVPEGALISATYDGVVEAVDLLSARRIQLTIRHEDAAGALRLSVLTGQIDTQLEPGMRVARGQPMARARPRRDGSTRLTFNFLIGREEIDPEPWFQPAN